MSHLWQKESTPTWDRAKRAILAANPGCFEFAGATLGRRLSGDWWLSHDGEALVGVAWLLDNSRGKEISIAVDARAQSRGVGRSAMDELFAWARAHEVPRIVGVVETSNPTGARVILWLDKMSFTPISHETLGKALAHFASGGNVSFELVL